MTIPTHGLLKRRSKSRFGTTSKWCSHLLQVQWNSIEFAEVRECGIISVAKACKCHSDDTFPTNDKSMVLSMNLSIWRAHSMFSSDFLCSRCSRTATRFPTTGLRQHSSLQSQCFAVDKKHKKHGLHTIRIWKIFMILWVQCDCICPFLRLEGSRRFESSLTTLLKIAPGEHARCNYGTSDGCLLLRLCDPVLASRPLDDVKMHWCSDAVIHVSMFVRKNPCNVVKRSGNWLLDKLWG